MLFATRGKRGSRLDGGLGTKGDRPIPTLLNQTSLRLSPRFPVADLCMPGPIYNWFCVAHSIVDVLSNAATIRASQVYPRTASAVVQRNLKRRTAQPVNEAGDGEFGPLVRKAPLDALDEMRGAHMGVCKVSALSFWTYPVL